MMIRKYTHVIRFAAALGFVAGGIFGVGQAAMPVGNAEQPDGVMLYWGQEPVEVQTRTRAQRCLNGLWQFIPSSSKTTPDQGWGYIWVPGAWSTVLSKMPGVVASGEGKAWGGFNTNNRSPGAAKVNCAWYRRVITIPEDWAGRRLFLDFDRVCTDAEVFVNGAKAGDVRWPGGEVEITSLVDGPGEAVVAMRVVSVLDKTEFTEFMGDAGDLTIKKTIKLDNRGVTGDVFLRSCDPGPYIDDIFIQPSTREKQLKVDFSVPEGELPESLEVAVACVNADGEVEKTYATTLPVTSPQQRDFEIVFDWEDPALWDFLQPNLYTLHLRVRGPGMDDEIAQDFGFREFWIDGRKFMLNGKEFRLRPRNAIRNHHDREIVSAEWMDGSIDGMISLGGNIQEFWPWDHYTRGTTRMLDLWCERADLKGWPVIAPLGSMRQFADEWDSADQEREEWLRLTEREVKQLRNHPSVMMWIHSPNRLPLKYDQDPTVLGNRERLTPADDDHYMNLLHSARQANQAVRDLDPTRPITLHHGAAAGDYHTINNYLSWIPLQEQEEWLSEYMVSGDMPYLPVEFGFIPHMDNRRGRNGWKGAQSSESLVTEYSAVSLGPRAFREETEETRRANPENFKRDQKYEQFFPALSPAIDEVNYQASKRVFLSWRTMGAPSTPLQWYLDYFWEKPNGGPKTRPKQISGPFEPGRRGAYVPTLTPYKLYYQCEMSMEPTKAAAYFDEAFAPVAAWICAPPQDGDIAAFTAKDHHFAAGATITKSIALINDTRATQPYTFTWQAFLGDEAIASGAGEGEIESAQNLFVPLAFDAPDIAEAKADGHIELTATIGGQTKTDRFDFRLYRPAPMVKQHLLIFDPEGKSRAMLQALGYTLSNWDGKPSGETLVIGREALTSGVTLPGNLENYVSDGGRVVILQQQPQWLEQHGFRVGAHVLRQVFPVDSVANRLGGVDATDLRDWSGHSSLRPVVGASMAQSSTSYPPHGWHWSNRGGVTSAPVEKPHVGNWTPLLECDFGSLYSPLLKMDYGEGEVILCQLDLEDHVQTDPAATLVCRGIISAGADAPAPALEGKTYVSASRRWKDLLKGMGLEFVPLTGKTIPGDCGLLVVGPEASLGEKPVLDFATSGGRVLSLPDSPLEGPKQTVPAYGGSPEVPAWSESAGLSVSDLHLRAPFDMELFVPDQSGAVEVAANGLLARRQVGEGVIVFTRFYPDVFKADKKTYFRITRWRSYRVLSQLLSNLRATFRGDVALFHTSEETASSPASINLAGPWRAWRTATLPTGSGNAKPNDPGISSKAKRIISGGSIPGGEAVEVPAYQESYGGPWTQFNGESVFQKEVMIPREWVGSDLVLELGIIDDFDNTYFNGVEIGKTDSKHERPWSHERLYVVPANLVREGGNRITVRVFDNYANGGLLGNSGELWLKPQDSAKPPLFNGWYSTDYREDFSLGDDPHRYYRW